MGNSPLAAAPHGVGTATIELFASLNSWIAGEAVEQLHQVAALGGVRQVAAFPDLHVGKHGPVGCAILADRIYPQLIGNDIGCGMSFFALDVPVRKLRLDKVAQRLWCLEGRWDGDPAARLRADGLCVGLHGAALGTLGGGNHFCEVQAVDTLLDAAAAARVGLNRDTSLLLVHSGSRSFGTAIFNTVLASEGGLEPTSSEAESYLAAHADAVAWARLNRQIIAERAADALRTSCRLLANSPHNLVEITPDGALHRKGAAKADDGLVPVAGSRDALSYVVQPTNTDPRALASIAHGAGRKYDRRSMSGRVGRSKSHRRELERNSFGGHIVCEDRNLLIEEAPQAYKDSRQVIEDLQNVGLVQPVAALKPLVTFKHALQDTSLDQTDRRERANRRRRDR